MLDIQLLRKDIDTVARRLKTRGFELDTETFNALEAQRKAIQVKTEELQSQRNKLSKEIGVRKAQKIDASDVMAQVAGIGDELKASAGHGDDETGRLARVAKGLAQVEDRLVEVVFLDHHVRPHRAQDLFLADHALAVLDQVGEHVEGTPRDR